MEKSCDCNFVCELSILGDILGSPIQIYISNKIKMFPISILNLKARRGSNVNVPFRERRKRKKILPPLQLPDVPKPEFHSHFELQMKMVRFCL